MDNSACRLLHHQALMAPGTPLRDGLERILACRTGALALSRNCAVGRVSTGGFELTVPFSAQAVRELAKMHSAIAHQPFEQPVGVIPLGDTVRVDESIPLLHLTKGMSVASSR